MKRATLVLLTLLPAPLAAQTTRTVQVQVTAVAGRDVFLDHGRDAGLQPGMRVRLLPAGAPGLVATVRAVSSRSASAEVAPGLPLPVAGTYGEVEVTDEPTRQEPDAPTLANRGRAAPDHPPWTRQEPARQGDTPLLAPAFGQPASARPMTWRGRVVGQLDWTRDDAGARSSDYLLARLGVDTDVRNAFGDGGLLRVAGDIERRGTDLLDDGSHSDDRARIERLSYRRGDEDYSGWRGEVGRFVSEYVPEFGLIDGVEGVVRLTNGVDLGAGFGALPLPFPARTAGEDVGAHLFAQVRGDGDRPWTALAALQKTWHQGAPDRDQLFGRAQLQPSQDLWLWTSARVDVYGSSDTRKSSDVEVTEAWAQLRWQPQKRRYGAALMASHYRWPDLKRREFATLPDDLVAHGHLERLGASAWTDLSDRLRLDGRVDLFFDRDSTGTAGEVRLDVDRVLEAKTTASVAVFYSDGSYLSGPGLRLEARRPCGAVDVAAGYEMLRWTQDVGDSSATNTRQSAHLDLGWRRSAWDVSLSSRVWFGDGESAMSLDLFGQYRF